MRARRESKIAAQLARVPVALLGVAITASAVQASCVGSMDDVAPDAGADSPADSPSQDSRADREDGMSYGDGYGGQDAHVIADAHVTDSESCVSSKVTYPPAPGCPAGNHVWTCWPPTSATSGIPDTHYTSLTLCGDVVVIDKNTHLMWGQDGEAGMFTWVEAGAACEASRRAGFSDWRLPSSNELMSLVDYANAKLILNPVFKDNFPSMWSSTPFAQQAGSAWHLDASGGIYPQAVTSESNVRCVR